MLPSHEPFPEQLTVQLLPPHVMGPRHEAAPVHAIVQLLA
jgi:hypothetical protein